MFRPTLFCHPQVRLRTETHERIIWPQLTNCVQQSPPAANIFPASHESSSMLWNTAVHFLHNSKLATFLHPVPDKTNPYTSSIPWISVWILPYNLRLGLPISLFQPGFLIKSLYVSLLSSPLLHACHMPRPSCFFFYLITPSFCCLLYSPLTSPFVTLTQIWLDTLGRNMDCVNIFHETKILPGESCCL